MARRKAKRAPGRKKRAKTPRGRRPARGRAVSRRTAVGASALAQARARVEALEAENRRLREELAAMRGESMTSLGPGGDDGPLAPGM